MDNRRIKSEQRGLCFRCEHRANYLETGQAPRMECGSPEMCVGGCYMYKPVRPVVVEQQNPDDPRPIFGPPMLAGRVRFKRVSNDDDNHLKLVQPNDNEYLVFWDMNDQ